MSSEQLTIEDFDRILSLRLKLSLRDPDAILEADQIAKRAGYSGHIPLVFEIDEILDRMAEGDDSDESWIVMGWTREFRIAFAVIIEAFKDYPSLADFCSKSRIMKDSSLFRELFEPGNKIRAYLDNKTSDPLPERPRDDAPIEDWFDYYDKREELGVPFGIKEIAKIKKRNPNYINQLHMRYNASHHGSKKKEEKT